MVYSTLCQSVDDSGAEKLNKLAEKNKGELINSTRELVMIKSVNGQPKQGAPFGKGPAQALVKALEIAKDLGFNTTNLDGYIGYAEYGQGTDYVGILAHVDVVPEGDGWKYPPMEQRFTMEGYTAVEQLMIRVQLWLHFML